VGHRSAYILDAVDTFISKILILKNLHNITQKHQNYQLEGLLIILLSEIYATGKKYIISRTFYTGDIQRMPMD
jgi:hypothetical protein